MRRTNRQVMLATHKNESRKMVSLKMVMRISESNKPDLVDIASSLLEPIRVREHCISSHLAQDMEEAGRFWLFQEWADEGALAEHIQSVGFRSLLASLDLLDGDWDITVDRLSDRHETKDPEELLDSLDDAE